MGEVERGVEQVGSRHQHHAGAKGDEIGIRRRVEAGGPSGHQAGEQPGAQDLDEGASPVRANEAPEQGARRRAEADENEIAKPVDAENHPERGRADARKRRKAQCRCRREPRHVGESRISAAHVEPAGRDPVHDFEGLHDLVHVDAGGRAGHGEDGLHVRLAGAADMDDDLAPTREKHGGMAKGASEALHALDHVPRGVTIGVQQHGGEADKSAHLVQGRRCVGLSFGVHARPDCDGRSTDQGILTCLGGERSNGYRGCARLVQGRRSGQGPVRPAVIGNEGNCLRKSAGKWSLGWTSLDIGFVHNLER